MKRRVLKLICFFMYLIICLGIYEREFVYHVKMNGKKYEVINVHDKYKDPGINVLYRGKKINKVISKSNINTDQIGKYSIKYYFNNKSSERTIEVKDLEKPIITLEKDNIELNINDKYIEPGYNANDNYDGDLTDKVIVKNDVDVSKIGNYKVYYTVKDSSNNETTQIRNVSVVDKIAPEIKFKNNLNMYAIKGKKIDINDYEAIDNYDGNITDKVVIDGKVNFKKTGIYTLTYTVSDSNQNTTTIKRTINVQNKNTNGVPVLMYHWFYDDTKGETSIGKPNAHNYISKTELKKQLEFLKDNKYYFPTWDELNKYIDGKIDLPQKSVIITDDDCVNSFFKVALPLFEEYEIPVTSFCITNKTNYQKYMKNKFLDFESHTDSMHQRSCNTFWNGKVMCSSYKEIYEDIKTSVKKIKNTNSFAYPFGHYNDNVIKALKENNIKLAFTINEGRVKRGQNKYKLPRVRISSWTDIDTYKKLLK